MRYLRRECFASPLFSSTPFSNPWMNSTNAASFWSSVQSSSNGIELISNRSPRSSSGDPNTNRVTIILNWKKVIFTSPHVYGDTCACCNYPMEPEGWQIQYISGHKIGLYIAEINLRSPSLPQSYLDCFDWLEIGIKRRFKIDLRLPSARM